MDAVLTAPDLPIESTDALDRAGHMSRMKIEDIEEISDFFNTSLLLVSIGDTENLISSYYSEQQQVAITSSIVESVIMSFTPTGTGAVMRSDAGDIDDNKVTQAHIKFFKNEKEAYNYIIDNTYEDLEECTNLPRPIENFGFITENGGSGIANRRI